MSLSRIKDEQRLELGADVVQRLLPHRRPLLMVDRVHGFERGERPTLWASRRISANEPVFEGHFPGLHLWPGIYTQEGLGQTCLLLVILMGLLEAGKERGQDAEQVLAALRNIELGYRLHPGFDPESAKLLDQLDGELPMGLSGSVQMRFLEPVFAGQTLEYRARRAQTLEGRLVRFEVDASAEGRVVAEGIMIGAVRFLPLPRRASP